MSVLNIIVAVLSFLFAVASWWFSNGSKKARAAAEEVARDSRRKVEALEQVAGAPLSFDKAKEDNTWILRNRTGGTLVITNITSIGGVRNSLENLQFPVELKGFSELKIKVFGAAGCPFDAIDVQLQGREELISLSS